MGLDGDNLLPLASSLCRGGVPVVHHLQSEDGVEGKAGDEAVQYQFVVDLLERGEDARQRAGQVVEDLDFISLAVILILER